MWPSEIPRPGEPVGVALVGTGNRARTIYAPLLRDYLSPWLQVVAACDPVRENCEAIAAELGVPAYHDLRELVRDTLSGMDRPHLNEFLAAWSD